eukprot:2160143-Pleurochrysis_carterae.AAC.1
MNRLGCPAAQFVQPGVRARLRSGRVGRVRTRASGIVCVRLCVRLYVRSCAWTRLCLRACMCACAPVLACICVRCAYARGCAAVSMRAGASQGAHRRRGNGLGRGGGAGHHHRHA